MVTISSSSTSSRPPIDLNTKRSRVLKSLFTASTTSRRPQDRTMPSSFLSNGASYQERHKILSNTLYLTFNAPQVDEYHRGLFLTYPPILTIPTPSHSGTLFHASYISDLQKTSNVNNPHYDQPHHKPHFEQDPSYITSNGHANGQKHILVKSTLDLVEPPEPPHWVLEHRIVRDLSSSRSLVLLYRLASYSEEEIEQKAHEVSRVIEGVPLGKEARTKSLGFADGNEALGGYDCMIWTSDALRALANANLVDFNGRTVDQIMVEARSLAGPADARTMVGVDFGGFRVIN